MAKGMPRNIWAHRSKDRKNLGDAFSFDGPPTDAYTTYIKKSEYDKAVTFIKNNTKCDHDVDFEDCKKCILLKELGEV